jgi:hypothetical protein
MDVTRYRLGKKDWIPANCRCFYVATTFMLALKYGQPPAHLILEASLPQVEHLEYELDPVSIKFQD